MRMENDNTPGIAEHLANSLTVWDSSQQSLNQLNHHDSFRRHDGTFFLSTRRASYARHYFWGTFSTDEMRKSLRGSVTTSSRVYDGDSSIETLQNSTVSADAAAETFPIATSPFDRCVPNTEEFLDYARVLHPLNGLKVVDVEQNELRTVVIACDEAGRLFTCGSVVVGFSVLSNPNANALGHGPARPQNDSGVVPPNPQVVGVLQRVYGDEDSFAGVKFVDVATTGRASFALDEDGDIWMAGIVEGFAEAADFSENSTDLPYFRKRPIAEWYDGSGTLQSGSLTFTKIKAAASSVFNVGEAAGVLMALDSNDKLFMFGTFYLGGRVTSSTPREVAGFVESVQMTAWGSGYTSNPTITVSPPDTAEGFAPTFLIKRDGGEIVAIYVNNPGWGYSSPPTITFTGGGGSGATATCTLFSRSWKTFAVSKGFGSSYGATTTTESPSTQYLYTWGGGGFWNVTDPENDITPGILATTPFKFYNSPVRASSTTVYDTEDLVMYDGGGLYVTSSNIYFWGFADVTPDNFQFPDNPPNAVLEAMGSVGKNLLLTLPNIDADLEIEGPFKAASTGNQGQVGIVTYDKKLLTWGRANSTGDIQRLGHGSKGTATTTVTVGVAPFSVTRAARPLAQIAGSALWHWGGAFGAGTCGFVATRRGTDSVELECDEYGLLKEPLDPYIAGS